jgi:hypothetical protein
MGGGKQFVKKKQNIYIKGKPSLLLLLFLLFPQTGHIPRASVGRYRYRLARLVPRYIVFNITKRGGYIKSGKKKKKKR